MSLTDQRRLELASMPDDLMSLAKDQFGSHYLQFEMWVSRVIDVAYDAGKASAPLQGRTELNEFWIEWWRKVLLDALKRGQITGMTERDSGGVNSLCNTALAAILAEGEIKRMEQGIVSDNLNRALELYPDRMEHHEAKAAEVREGTKRP